MTFAAAGCPLCVVSLAGDRFEMMEADVSNTDATNGKLYQLIGYGALVHAMEVK